MKDLLELGPLGWVRNEVLWEPENPFFGVLGDPVQHSLSPAMQNAALAERELEHEYLPIRLASDQIEKMKQLSSSSQLAGFNVTAPLKEKVAILCEHLTEQANTLGAVNAVKVENGIWRGHNTDSGGMLSVLTEAWPTDTSPGKAIVLGSGGAARAAVDALVRWGATEISVQAHSAEGLERFSKWIGSIDEFKHVTVEPLPSEHPPVPEKPIVWVCCLKGQVSAKPYLPDAAGNDHSFLLDLRYGSQLPDEDPPLGMKFSDGLPVLLMQGVLSFAWWFGPPIPMQTMRSALL